MSVFRSVTKTIDAGGLTPGQVLMLAAVSMKDLSWDYYIKDEKNLYARSHMGLLTWGESLHVQVTEEQIIVTCTQPSWKYFRPHQSEENITELLSYIEYNRQILSPEELTQEIDEILLQKPRKLLPSEKIVMGNTIPPATGLIIACNLLYFLLFSFSTASFFEPSVMDIFNWGGNIRLYTFGGDWWRVITSCFLHIGFFHLIGNMFVLFFIGRLLEPVIKRYLFTAVYLCTGIVGSVTSVVEAGNRISAGASGAIFGLYGVFIALLTTKMITGEIKRVLFQSIILFTVYGLFSGMSEGVDNAAHLGGLLSGFVFGYLIYAGYDTGRKQMIALAGITLITVVFTVFCLDFFHNDTIRYKEMLQRMQMYEHNALAERTDMKLKTNEEQLTGLTKTARKNWQLFQKTIDSTTDFRFGRNKVYETQKSLLTHYVKYRLAENEIWIQSLKTGNEMKQEKDSIRLLVYEKYDSLLQLRQ